MGGNATKTSTASLNVFASQLVFEKATEVAPLDQVEIDFPGGTHIAILHL